MTKINNRKVREIGRYLYADDFGKLYILNAKRDAYLMLDERQQRIFQLFRLRFVIAMLAGFLFHYYASRAIAALCLGIGIFAVLQLTYRFWFLPSLTEVKGTVEIARRGLLENLSLAPRSSLIKLVVLSGVISVLFFYNFVTLFLWPTLVLPLDGEGLLSWVLYLAMIFGSGGVCLLSALYLYKRRKES